MTDEEIRRLVEACSKGRNSCSGCKWGAHCAAMKKSGKRLAELLVAIDPGGNIALVRLHPLMEITQPEVNDAH